MHGMTHMHGLACMHGFTPWVSLHGLFQINQEILLILTRIGQIPHFTQVIKHKRHTSHVLLNAL